MVFNLGPGFWSWEKTAELAPPRADRNGPREYTRALIRASGSRDGHLEPCNDSIADFIERGVKADSAWNEADMVGDPSARAEEGWRVHNETWASHNTPLHMAMTSPAFEKTVCLLISHGADPNRRNVCGETVLYQWSDDPKKVSLLLRLGADPNIRTEESLITCFNYYTQERPGRLSPLFRAVASGSLESCRLLLSAQADANMPLPGRWYLLDYAVLRRDREIVQALLENGAVFSSIQETAPAGERCTRPPSQKHIEALARQLLLGQKSLPHPDARPVFDMIVESDAVVRLMDSELGGRERSAALISAFYGKLTSLAHTSNPLRPSVPHCDLCTAMQSDPLLWAGQRSVTVRWGTMADLEGSATANCPLCRLIFKPLLLELKRKKKAFEDQKEEVAINFNENMCQVRCGKVSTRFVVQSLADEFTRGIEVLDRSAGTSSPASMAMARRWLDNCESAHVGTCSHCPRMPGEPPELPTRVIDVGDAERPPRLVETRGFRSEYFALSYCWGQAQAPALRTEKASLHQHLEAIPMEPLPKTLRDAISFTREMGMRYLWIDSLCIIQDDHDDWAYEAARMQKVYLNARLVLSALDSDHNNGGLFRDAQSGLPPFVQLSIPSPSDKPGRTCHYALPWRVADGAKELARGPITKRAWVLQEESLAARILYFGAEMLYWECLAVTASESEPDGLQRDGQRLQRKDNRARRKWLQSRDLTCDCHVAPYSKAGKGESGDDGDFYQAWEESVAMYTRRSLSVHTDRIPAILGLGMRMQSALHCRFVAGVCTDAYALRSLCWQVIGQPGRLNACYPSWSWASTTTSVEYRLLNSEVLRTTTVEWLAEVVAIDTDHSLSQNRASGTVRTRGLLKKNPGPLRKGNIGVFDTVSSSDNTHSDTESTTSEPLPPWSDSDLDSDDSGPEDNTSQPTAPLHRPHRVTRVQKPQRPIYEPECEEGVKVLLDRPVPSLRESYFLAIARTQSRLPDIRLNEKWDFVQGKDKTQQTTICLVMEPVDPQRETWRRVGICSIEVVAYDFWDDSVEGEVVIV